MSGLSRSEINKRYYQSHLEYERARQVARKRRPLSRIVDTWKAMRYRVAGRTPKDADYVGLSLLPREEFIAWSLADPGYARLFEAWEESGFVRTLAPSIDRINSSKGYDLNNIQWLTLSDNCRKGSK